MTTFQTPVRCEAFPDSGKTGRVFISGSRKTISFRGCSSPCVTAQGAFKPARCDCLSPRRKGCDTSGSPLPIFRTEPAQAARSISSSVLADLPRDARIVIVEGVLKADVLYALRPELYIVATPCVTANHGALVELTRGRPVLMAFDQDLYSNETVCFHLAALVARRLRRERTLATTRIASWDAKVKGIDDAAVRNLPITSISVKQWLDRLSPRFRQIAMTRLSEIAKVSRRTRSKSDSQGL